MKLYNVVDPEGIGYLIEANSPTRALRLSLPKWEEDFAEDVQRNGDRSFWLSAYAGGECEAAGKATLSASQRPVLSDVVKWV